MNSTWLILILTVALPQIGLAEFPDSGDAVLIQAALASTFNEDYTHSQNLLEYLNQKYPEHPCGTFFQAATLLAAMSDREHFENDKYFSSLIRQTINRADKLRDNNPKSAWAYYFMGMANFYQALQDTRKSKKISVLKYGTRGKNLLEKALELDSTLFEACFGLGNYHYWGSVKTRGYEWLPFIGDNRQKGIAYLHQSANSSLFSGDLAKSVLIRVYYNESHTDSAEALLEDMLAKYPDGKSFLWARAEGNFINKNYGGALIYYDELAQKIKTDKLQNNYNSLQIAYQQILCYYNLKLYDRALMRIEQVQDIKLSQENRRRHKHNLKEIRKLKEKILKALQPKN